MKIILSTMAVEQEKAWVDAFEGCAEVEVYRGSILDLTCSAIVSPANNFGFMDGGIDLQYSVFFGRSLQSRLQDRIMQRYSGELLVGQALILETFNKQIPYMISAPTMRVPQRLGTSVNAYLAMRAALLLVKNDVIPDGDDEGSRVCDKVTSVAFPGMGTGVGGLTVKQCSEQMRAAYDRVFSTHVTFPGTISEATIEHDWLARSQ